MPTVYKCEECHSIFNLKPQYFETPRCPVCGNDKIIECGTNKNKSNT